MERFKVNFKKLKNNQKIKILKGCGNKNNANCEFQSNSDGKIRFTFSHNIESINTEKNVDNTNITMPYKCLNNFENKNVNEKIK